MKRIPTLLLLLLLSHICIKGQTTAIESLVRQIHDCDLVFHVSDRPNAITDVTRGIDWLKIDHVGIYACIDGRPSIIEATTGKGVVITPIDSFLRRNVPPGGTPMIIVGRVTDRIDRERSLTNALGYVGCGYDSLFLPDNKEIYCSELVQKSFVKTDGTPVFNTIPMEFRDANGDIPEYWTSFYARHGMAVPEGRPGTNPGEMSRRPNVRIIISPNTLAPADSLRTEVLLETTEGNIRIALYNETPQHRDNFVRLADEHFYDSLLFHRVIRNFMIQAGDPDSRHAQPGVELGESSTDYTLPAEICLPGIFHRRGAVAMAREGDDVNPERRSSGSQFYIVWGKRFSTADIEYMQQWLDTTSNGRINMTPDMMTTYRKTGGTPHLDGTYTVFGEVIEGLDIVERIQEADTDDNDRPVYDVRILRATVTKRRP